MVDPVAERGLHHSQRRHRRGIRPQDARPERQLGHERLLQQRRTFILGKSTFRADQNIHAAFCPTGEVLPSAPYPRLSNNVP